MLKQNLIENQEKIDRVGNKVKNQNRRVLNNAANEKEFW
jgi:hypothetical protein